MDVERIGHYRIVSELGRGGMGVVYKAHEESLNRHVALKVLGEHLEEDDTYVQRFLREAQSAAKLSHPNIVQIYAISEDNGRHFFAMEYVSGTSLQRLLRTEGRMAVDQAARLILQTASGLAAAHDQGVIHRDIKPANLLIDERGLVKIADFGLALMAGAVSRLTATGMFMGTPGYLSPEQCLDANPDHRTDIYSLGVTFYEMLTGKIPFTADSPLALLKQIVEVEPPDVQELNPEIDDATRTTLTKMMAKDRKARHSDCHELILEVRNLLESAGLSTHEAAGLATGSVTPPVVLQTHDPIRTEAINELNTSPTVMVSADAAASGAPEPPPLPPPPPQASAVDEPEEIPPASVPSANRRVLIAVAAVVLAAIAAIVIGGVVVWKTGVLSAFMGDGNQAAAAPQKTAPGTQSADGSASTGNPAEVVALAAAAAESSGRTVETEHETATGIAQQASPPPSTTTQPGTSAAAGAAAIADQPQSASGQNATRHREEVLNSQAPATEVMAAATPVGTAVVAVGEPMLARETEAFLERALDRAGIPVVDELGIPAVTDLAMAGADPRLDDLLRVLKPHAVTLLLVRAEFVGERPLRYMNRMDVAFKSRLFVTAFDVASGEPMTPSLSESVEYTQVSVERVVAKTLRPRARRLLGVLQ